MAVTSVPPSDDYPFALAPTPPKEEGLGWTLKPVCLRNRFGERCVDDYTEDLREYWRLQTQKYLQEHPA